MKEIKAVIQPARLARLREAFRRVPDFPGMTVTRVEGTGHHPQDPNPPGIKSDLTDYSPKMRIEIVCEDARVDELLRAIRDACRTGLAGDGLVWVTDVLDVQRIRE